MPHPEVFEICIANGAYWINLDHQLRAEISPIFSNSPATYCSHRECVGRRQLKKRGIWPPPRSALGWPPKTGICVAVHIVLVMHFIQIPTFNKYCQLFPCKYQHYVDIHHHRIYEFVGISNVMLFVNKQTNIWCPLKCRSPVYICT